MATMILLFSDQRLPHSDGIVVHWQKRETAPGEISLSNAVDENLVAIRKEHMAWAYDMAFVNYHGQSLDALLSGAHEPSMWWTSLLYERHPKLSPNLYLVYKLRCLETLLIKNNCSNLEVHGDAKEVKENLRDLCQTLGIKLTWHPQSHTAKKHKSLKERLYYSCPAPLRAMIRLAHWYWTIRRKLPKAIDRHAGWNTGLSGKEATIVTYFPNIDLHAASQGRFRSRYWEKLHHLLSEEARLKYGGKQFVHWIFIRFPSPDLSFEQCIKLKDNFQKNGLDGLSFNYLEEFLSLNDIWQALRRWWKITRNSLTIENHFAENCHFSGSALNFWPLMRQQWAESFRGWRCLERSLQNIAFRNYANFAKPQRWTLFPLENCPWERMLTTAIRKVPHPWPVYGAQHSIIRRTDFRYFDDPRTFSNPDCSTFQPDIIGGNGQSACSQLMENHIPSERLMMLEALRYLYLQPEQSKKTSLLPPEPGAPLIDDSQKSLVLLTSFFEDETRVHLDLLGKALDEGIFKDWIIEIKPHPYLPVDQWVNSRSQAEQRQIRIRTGSMNEILKPGPIFWTSNSTTAALEVLLKQLPLMVMAPFNDFDLCPVQNVQGLLRTGTLDDVRNAINLAKPLSVPADYLDLNTDLLAWRKLLNLE